MKRRKPKKPATATQDAQVPDWVLDDAPKRGKPCTKEELDKLADDVRAGIEDTPAWKDCVRRYGKTEAAKILKLALFREHVVQGDMNN